MTKHIHIHLGDKKAFKDGITQQGQKLEQALGEVTRYIMPAYDVHNAQGNEEGKKAIRQISQLI